MNYLKCFMLILVVLLSDVAFSQTILKRSKKFVIVDIDETFGLQVNDQVNIYKKFESGSIQNVGTLKIVMFKKGKCIGQIVSENATFPVTIGDYIAMEDDMSAELDKLSSADNSAPSRSNTLTYLSFGVGLAASGLGYYFYNQANQNYDDYKAATTPQDAVDLYDKTIANDNKAKIGLGVGGGLIALGVISYLMNHNKPQPKPDRTFSLQPVWEKNFIGFGVNLCFNQPYRR